jgi:membrane protease YdiL (CAAX protease family)
MLSFIMEMGISLLVILPMLFLFGKKNLLFSTILVFFLYFIVDSFLTSLALLNSSFRFVGGSMNWEGKIMSYLGAFAMIHFYSRLSYKQIGLTLVQNDDSKAFARLVTIIISVLFFAYSIVIGGYSGGLENILFQLTMPSIVEEIVYRGILMTLLNQTLTKPFQWGKTKFGGAAIITSTLFGMWHGLSITADLNIEIAWFPLIFTGLIGFVLALVKERTGSLVYPIVLHVIINVLPNLVGYFI